MKMKKSVSIILTGVFTLSMATTAFASNQLPATSLDSAVAVISPAEQLSASVMYGKITNITENKGVKSLEITGYGDQAEKIIVHLSETTFVLDAMTGLPMDLDKRINDDVAVYYGPIATMSIPAQSPGVCVLGNIAQDASFPNYAKVEAVIEGKDGSIVVTTDGGSRLVTLGKDMPITPHLTKNIVQISDVQVGSELLLWYDMMALSMPAQANATKAIILRQPSAVVENTATAVVEDTATATSDKMILSTQAGALSVNQKEINVNNAKNFYKNANGDMMVPVRAVAEALGYEVRWTKGSDQIVLQKEARTATFQVGDANYGANKMLVRLNSAPEVKNCVTYVPTDFFAQALEVEVVVNDSHV